MKKLAIAIGLLLLGSTLPAIAQQVVLPCYKVGQTSCNPVSAVNPLPVSGTITTTPSGQQNVNLNQINGATVSAGNPLPVSLTAVANVTGNVASASADSGAPVKTGGKYNTTLPTFANGQRGDTQIDSFGRTFTTSTSASYLTGQVSVGTTATLVALGTATSTLTRITNLGTTDVFCGFNTVSITTGDLLVGTKGASITFPTSTHVYCVVGTGTATVSYTQFN